MIFTHNLLGQKHVVAEIGDSIYFTQMPLSEQDLVGRFAEIIEIEERLNSSNRYKVEVDKKQFWVTRNCFELSQTTEMIKYFNA